jgi:hypothetical protein
MFVDSAGDVVNAFEMYSRLLSGVGLREIDIDIVRTPVRKEKLR